MSHLFFRGQTQRLPTLLLGLLLCGGCRSYAPAPIHWSREAAEWSASAPPRAPLTLAEARQIALILNPEINALRLKRLSSEKQAQAAGWWEDPALGLDASRVLRGGPHPWILGSGLSFTLPLTGVPGLEKRAALAYAQADALAVTAAERELIAEVDRLWLGCRTDSRCAVAQQDYAARLQSREQTARALIAAGELPRAEGDRIAQERIRLELECACCGTETIARRQALLRRLGLHPSAPLELAEESGAASSDNRASPSGPLPGSDLDLVRHPRVREALARFAAGEEALRAEIRKQFPDLETGPLFGHEEGTGRLGASLGFTLPLWNRNRKGVASAEGTRDAARLEARNVWRGLVAEWHEARRLLQTAEAKEQRIRETQLPEAQRAAEQTERLFRQGEADVLALLAADETLYNAQEALIEAQRTLGEARIRLDLLRIPNEEPAPACRAASGAKRIRRQ